MDVFFVFGLVEIGCCLCEELHGVASGKVK